MSSPAFARAVSVPPEGWFLPPPCSQLQVDLPAHPPWGLDWPFPATQLGESSPEARRDWLQALSLPLPPWRGLELRVEPAVLTAFYPTQSWRLLVTVPCPQKQAL